MENSLPIGWEEISLEEIASYVIGGDWGKDSQEVDHERVFVVRGTDYKNWDKIRGKNAATRYFKKQSIEKRQLTEGDIILEVSGGGPDQPVGRVVSIDRKALESVDGKLSFSNFFRLIRLDKNINPYFVKAYLDYAYYRGDFNDMQTHTTNLRNLRVNEFLSKTMVPIPPLAEQQRLVAKLGELMEKIDRSRARLERIPKILKRFRQSILSVAVSGKLFNANSEWREVKLSSLVKKGDIFDGPFGSNLKTLDYTDKGIRVIRLENIEHLYFVNEKETFISKEKYQTLLRHTVGEGDIIFSSFITEEIRACMVPKLSTTAIAKADCFCIRPNEHLVNKQFLLYSLVSSNSYNQLVLNIHGATRPRINTTQLKELTLFLPELEEQNEIVRRVDHLFLVADKIEARYNTAKAQVDRFPQSLLAKAFNGELVPQDESDEPASLLLARINDKLTPRSVKKTRTKEYQIEPPASIGIAAESKSKYAKSVTIKIPENKRAFAKQVLGGKIVSLFKDDPHFTHIKFQKLQYLAEHLAEVDLNWNYYRQSAGPYDPKFMHTVAFKLKTSKWFEEKKYKFHPLEKADKIEGYYEGYFKPASTKLDSLFSALKQSTEDEAEIIATLYAVWNNMIVNKERINDDVIVSTFFEWSDRKKKYTRSQVGKALAWMKKNGFVPTGFGRVIKERKK